MKYNVSDVLDYYANFNLSNTNNFFDNHLELLQFKHQKQLRYDLDLESPRFRPISEQWDRYYYTNMFSYYKQSIYVPIKYLQPPLFDVKWSPEIIDPLWAVILSFEIVEALEFQAMAFKEPHRLTPFGLAIVQHLLKLPVPEESPDLSHTYLFQGKVAFHEALQYYKHRSTAKDHSDVGEWLANRSITHQQFFYINTAQYFCKLTHTTSMHPFIYEFEHHIKQHWQNSDEFRKAFDCKAEASEAKSHESELEEHKLEDFS